MPRHMLDTTRRSSSSRRTERMRPGSIRKAVLLCCCTLLAVAGTAAPLGSSPQLRDPNQHGQGNPRQLLWSLFGRIKGPQAEPQEPEHEGLESIGAPMQSADQLDDNIKSIIDSGMRMQPQGAQRLRITPEQIHKEEAAEEGEFGNAQQETWGRAGTSRAPRPSVGRLRIRTAEEKPQGGGGEGSRAPPAAQRQARQPSSALRKELQPSGEQQQQQQKAAAAGSKRPMSSRGRRTNKSHREKEECNSRHLEPLLTKFSKEMGDSTFMSRDQQPAHLAKEVFKEGDLWVLPWTNPGVLRRYNLDRCAIVGNSGHLRLAHFGTAIDLFDAVIRTNQAPIKGYGQYVGTKTTFRLINRSITKMYQRAMSHWKRKKKPEGAGASKGNGGGQRRLLQRPESVEGGNSTSPRSGVLLPLEPNVTMVLISEIRSRPGDTVRLHKALKPKRPDVNILTLSGKSRRASERLLIAWNQQQELCTGRNTGKGNVNRGTTGLLAVAMAMHLCKQVTLFGFGQPRAGTRAAPYHYYTGLRNRSWKSKSSKVHNFAGEASLIRHLHSLGKVEMCNEASPATCGLPHWKVLELMRKKNADPGPENPEHKEAKISFEDIGDPAEDSDYDALEVTNNDLLEQMMEEEKEEKEDAAGGAEEDREGTGQGDAGAPAEEQ